MTSFFRFSGPQRAGILHSYPASSARDHGGFLANGLGPKSPYGGHGEQRGKRKPGKTGSDSLKRDVSLEKSRQGSLTSPCHYSKKRQLNSQTREKTIITLFND